MNEESRWRNQFLLAMPELAGSYFGATITYLCEHNDEGAMGLIVNREVPDVRLGDLFEQLEIVGPAHRQAPVLEGGPVQRDRGFVLHTDDVVTEDTLKLGEGLALSTSLDILKAISEDRGPERFLACVGYAGWGGGQLEAEMGDNSWLTCPGDPEILFEVPFAERVDRAAAQLGIDFSLIGSTPGHA